MWLGCTHGSRAGSVVLRSLGVASCHGESFLWVHGCTISIGYHSQQPVLGAESLKMPHRFRVTLFGVWAQAVCLPFS